MRTKPRDPLLSILDVANIVTSSGSIFEVGKVSRPPIKMVEEI